MKNSVSKNHLFSTYLMAKYTKTVFQEIRELIFWILKKLYNSILVKTLHLPTLLLKNPECLSPFYLIEPAFVELEFKH